MKDFSKFGRVNYTLKRRLELLAEVQRLAETIQVEGVRTYHTLNDGEGTVDIYGYHGATSTFYWGGGRVDCSAVRKEGVSRLTPMFGTGRSWQFFCDASGPLSGIVSSVGIDTLVVGTWICIYIIEVGR